MNEEVPQVRLPRRLSRRIEKVLDEPALGYDTFDSFVFAAIRRELHRAEKTAYFLREGAR